MLVIDFAFFVLELGVGVYVGSLALMADAFHMVCWALATHELDSLS
jgi:zinc transporter 1